MEEEIKKEDPEINPSDLNRTSPKSELDECKEKCQEYLNNWKRSAADFINYKKDEMEKIGQLIKYANQKIILKILPILDSLSSPLLILFSVLVPLLVAAVDLFP